MKNLNNLIWLFFFLVLYSPSRADVIYAPVTHMGAVVSLEGIVSYELAFSNSNTFNLWGGGGVVFPLGYLNFPAYGTEAALEFRQYFRKNSYKNFCLGLYAGLACMYAPEIYRGKMARREKSTGFVPGLKITHKWNLLPSFAAEPYLSISFPFYEDKLSETLSKNSDAGLIVTLGVRLGFNWIKILHEQ